MKGIQVVEMKRIISLILALSCIFAVALSFASCASCGGTAARDVFTVAKESTPTKIVTEVYYKDKNKQKLDGHYVMQIEGNNSIFEYEYDRYRTVEEGVTDGSYETIKTVSGVVYFKDGKTSTDGESWDSEAITAVDLKFDLKAEYLTGLTYSEDGTTIYATMTPENSVKVVGTDLSAKESVYIEVKTNGTNLTFITLSCETKSGGTMKIVTSYSYNKLTLEFPEA